jgi:hypothetical protein
MNINAQALLFAIVTVASAASIGMGLADRAAQPDVEVVKLERVVIVGKRAAAPVVTASLPRVIVSGRSVALADMQLASAQPASKTL